MLTKAMSPPPTKHTLSLRTAVAHVVNLYAKQKEGNVKDVIGRENKQETNKHEERESYTWKKEN